VVYLLLSHLSANVVKGEVQIRSVEMGVILVVVLVLLLLGAIPTWPYSRNWGYWPSGSLGLIVVVVLILLLLGRV